MTEPKDKRTKEYKEWKRSEGLGDTIEKVLDNPVGKALKKLIFKDGDDCGCEARKKLLNKVFRYKKKPRCLSEEQYNRYGEYVANRKAMTWTTEEQQLLIDLYAWVFAIQHHIKNFCRDCSGSGQTLLKMSNELDKVYDTYAN